MSYRIRRLLNHLPFAPVLRGDRWLKGTLLRPAPYAGFLEESGLGRRPSSRYERHLRHRRFRRLAKGLFLWASAFGVVWIALESVRAVVLF